MKIKRFSAATMREAMQSMRVELGTDAVILANHSVAGRVEVVGAIDYDETLLREAAPQASDTVSPSPQGSGFSPLESAMAMGRGGGLPSLSDGRPPAHEEPSPRIDLDTLPLLGTAGPIQTLDNSVAELKEFVQHHLLGLVWEGTASNRPNQSAAARELLQAGFDTGISRSLVERIPQGASPEEAYGLVLRLLADELGEPEFLPHEQGGRIALSGPGGSGKTTAAVKIAAQAARVHGAHRVALVSLDHRGIGALEQIHTYGQLLGIGVRVAQPADRLGEILEELSDRAVVVVDTAGFTPMESGLMQQKRVLSQLESRGLQPCLVLPAYAEARFLDRVIDHYATQGCEHCILTHVDQAVSPGVLLSAVMRARLQPIYVNDGNAVAQPLISFDARQLVRRLLLGGEPADTQSTLTKPERRSAHGA